MEGAQDGPASVQCWPLQQVRVVRVSLVKPAKPTVLHSMCMSVVDQMLRGAPPSRTLLFYRTDKDPAVALEALQHGLASTLVPFYPMAGRLMLQEDGRLALYCNDKGVELVEAHCDIPYTELEQDNFRIRPLFRQLAPMDSSKSSDILDDPIASFQVTSFIGGLTVGITILHSVADGYAMWTFIQAVAHACRGEPLSMIPLHARTLLMPEMMRMGTSFPGMPFDELTRMDAAPYNGCEQVVRASNLDPELLQQKVLHFSHEMIEALKRACLSSDYTDTRAKKSGSCISTYQALAAYLWKRLTMAQGLEDETCVDLRVMVDVRSRMIPPLTPAFFGNAVVGIPTPTTAGELRCESLGATAARILKSIRQGDDMYIKKAIIAREKSDLQRILLSQVKVTLIRNASAFPVYDGGDFGWGEPEAVRPPWDVREGEFTWYPGKKPKSIDVIASLTDTTCANFFSPRLYPNDLLAQYAFPAQVGV